MNAAWVAVLYEDGSPYSVAQIFLCHLHTRP